MPDNFVHCGNVFAIIRGSAHGEPAPRKQLTLHYIKTNIIYYRKCNIQHHTPWLCPPQSVSCAHRAKHIFVERLFSRPEPVAAPEAVSGQLSPKRGAQPSMYKFASISRCLFVRDCIRLESVQGNVPSLIDSIWATTLWGTIRDCGYGGTTRWRMEWLCAYYSVFFVM